MIEQQLEVVLDVLGYEPTGHMKDTPKRWARSLKEMTTPQDFKFTTFEHDGDSEMVAVGPIKFYSLCAHHVLPFFGEAFVAYIPKGKVAGLSKLARVVKETSKGLWVQENLTTEIADLLEENLDPIGAAVVMKAEHLCMTMRGVKEPGARTTTSEMRGAFLTPTIEGANPREEFFGIINGQR